MVDADFPPTPPAFALAFALVDLRGVELATAVFWLAKRADKFKQLNGFTADQLNQITKVTT